MAEKLTTEEFIKKSQKVHGVGTYNYNGTEYHNSKDKVRIDCPKHGPFWQTPHNHLQGAGCPKCAQENTATINRLTVEIFIERAIKIHGSDTYEYGHFEYKNANTEGRIDCPKHGPFWQTPHSHLKGSGCPKCGVEKARMGRQKTKELFIKQAQMVHGPNKYVYDHSEYERSDIKVQIDCPKHGPFWQTPSIHLQGSGCPKCAHESTATINSLMVEIFIERAIKVHGSDTYEYGHFEYKDSKTKGRIDCPKHGPFWQTPSSHLQGQGCPKCGYENTSAKNRLTTEIFIERAIKVHGSDTYEYGHFEYKDSKTKGRIDCPKHGPFWQTPSSHLQGVGCPQCGTEKIWSDRKKNTEIFIEQAQMVHGSNKYVYDHSEYERSDIKVQIDCPKHGPFWQTPNAHLQGAGCPTCTASKLEKQIRRLLALNCIDHNCQKTFDWLRIKSSLRLDFYLPSLNLAIEAQGAQHFRPVSFGSHEDVAKMYADVVERDTIKRQLCEEHGIKILYFANQCDIPEEWTDYDVIIDEDELLAEIMKHSEKIA